MRGASEDGRSPGEGPRGAYLEGSGDPPDDGAVALLRRTPVLPTRPGTLNGIGVGRIFKASCVSQRAPDVSCQPGLETKATAAGRSSIPTVVALGDFRSTQVVPSALNLAERENPH